MSHICPVQECTIPLPDHILMCLPHWRLVPKPLQGRVYAEWNHGHPTPAYPGVRQKAIDSAHRKLAARPK